jgi:hypothetical protein
VNLGEEGDGDEGGDNPKCYDEQGEGGAAYA